MLLLILNSDNIRVSDHGIPAIQTEGSHGGAGGPGG
jgi:hypothetical protein